MSLAADPGRRWSEHGGWIAALLVAAILQGIVAWRSPLVARDGIDFIRYAQGLPQQGRELIRVKDQHPGYPLLILESAALVRPWVASETRLWIIAARIPSLALGLGSVAVVWLLARRLFDRWTADLAALICAAMPIFRQNAADALTDSPHMFFYLLATWLACEGLSRMSWPWWAAAGAASSLAYWIRPEGLAPACVAGATLLLVAVVWLGRDFRRVAKCGLALGAAIAICALPYPVLSGKFTSKQNPYSQHEPRVPYLVNEALHDPSLAQATAGPATPDEPAAAAPAAASPTAASPPAAVPQPPTPPRPQFKARLLLRTLGLALVELGDELARGFRFYFLVFYAIGYLEFRHRPLERKVFVFVYGLATLHILLLLGVFFMSGYISHRHVMPLVALAMPWIALGIIYTADTCRRLLRLELPAPALALGLTIVCCAIVVPRAVRELHPGFLPALSAAGWAKAQTRPGDWLVSNSKYVSYFSERPTVLLNERTPTIAAARATLGSEHPDRFVVLDLAEEGFQPGWLEELKSGSQQRLQYDAVVRGTMTPRVLVLEPIPQVAGIPVGAGTAAPSPSATPPTPNR